MSTSMLLLARAVKTADFGLFCDVIAESLPVGRRMLLLFKLFSYAIEALGIVLVVYCTCFLERCLIPHVAAGTTLYLYFLHALCCVFSFNILFHYIASTTFSRRIGTGARPPQLTPEEDMAMPLYEYLWRQLCACFSPLQASEEAMAEIERLDAAAERFTSHERARRLLHEPHRYCPHCRRFKAPREHHCKTCNACVPRRDHHCPWINNCVDVENQRHFVSFVVWLATGALLDVAFSGLAFWRQFRYERRLLRLLQAGASTEELSKAWSAPPYNHDAGVLAGTSARLNLALALSMGVCMLFFAWANVRMLLRNSTPVEDILVDEKRTVVYGPTNFHYRSPYDLGWRRNLLQAFRVPRDAFENCYHDVKGDHDGERSGTHTCSPAVSKVVSCAPWLADAALLWWAVVVCTLQPTRHDGIHYQTFGAALESVRAGDGGGAVTRAAAASQTAAASVSVAATAAVVSAAPGVAPLRAAEARPPNATTEVRIEAREREEADDSGCDDVEMPLVSYD